jgi:hypothetical protein
MKNKLDFSLLSRFDTRSLFVRLPGEDEEAIEILPETSARIEGALKFCWYVSATTDALFVNEPKATRLREAFLRASLAEYVSIEDTLERDLHGLNTNIKALKIWNLKNPLLHIMRELRNLEIHLTSSKLSESKINVLLVHKGIEHQSEKTIWTVNDLTVEKFQSLRYAKERYSQTEIKKMVDWFNDAQQDWGVHDLLYRAICELSSIIIETYSLRQANNLLNSTAR